MKNRGSSGVRKFGMITYAYKGSIPTGMSNGTFGMSSFSGLEAVSHNLKWKFVILNPSPFVILSVAKNLVFLLRINSVKNLMISTHYKTEILRLKPQNDIVT